MARIGRPDILWSVNKLARSITKWTKACDKRLNIHHTSEYKQYCHVGNTAKQCRLGLFQDSDFAGDLEDSKSISGGTLCIFGSHTFVPISWMCKKQTSVSHSSTESEIISLDTGLRLDGLLALELWDLFVSVQTKLKQILRVFWKLMNPHECVWEIRYRIIVKTILQEEETIHYRIKNLVHKFIPMPQAMKFPAAKAAVDKEWEKLAKISAWNLTKVRSKKEVSMKQGRRAQ